jgi:hypothetical protein
MGSYIISYYPIFSVRMGGLSPHCNSKVEISTNMAVGKHQFPFKLPILTVSSNVTDTAVRVYTIAECCTA